MSLSSHVQRRPFRTPLVLLYVGLTLTCGKESTAPRVPAAIVKVSGDGQSGRVNQSLPPLVVKVTDASGAGIGGVAVAWAVTEPDGFAQQQSTTDATGLAELSAVFDTVAGSYAIAASAGSLAPVVFTVTCRGGPAVKLAFAVQPATATALLPINPAVQIAAEDRWGNLTDTFPAGGGSLRVQVLLTAGSGTASANLGGTSLKSAVSGVATFDSLAIDKVGTGYTLTAVGNAVLAAVSAPFSVVPGTGSALAVTATPSDTVAGATLGAVRVEIRDLAGNRVPSATDSITLAVQSGTGSAGAVLAGTTRRAAVGGVATFNDLSIAKSGDGYGLTASAAGLGSASAGYFAIRADTPTALTFVAQPANVSAWRTMSPAAIVGLADRFGNLALVSRTVTLAIAPGTGASGAVLGGTLSEVSGPGAVFGDLTIDRAGTGYQLVASSPGLTAATSAAFDVGPEQYRLAFDAQPSGVMPGAVLAPPVRVAVKDHRDSTVTGSTAPVTLGLSVWSQGSGPANLGGTRTQAAVGGVASFADLTVSQDGAYQLMASSPGLDSAASTTFQVPSHLVIATQPSTAVAGATITPAVVVWVTDYVGNPIGTTTSVTLSIASGTAGATLGGTVIRQAVNGVASFNDLTLDKAGTFAFNATVVGLPTVMSDTFDVTTPLGFIGQPSDAMLGAAITPPVRVAVEDAAGNIVTGATDAIALAVDSATGTLGARLLGTPTRSAVGGVASFDDVTVDRLGAGYRFVARASGASPTRSGAFTVRGAAQKVVAAWWRTCALERGGQEYCWGSGLSVRLIDGVPSFSSLAAGGEGQTCGLTSAGAAWCWTPWTATPSAVPGGLSFTGLWAGYFQTCGLVAGGEAYCWGSINDQGQLGVGDTLPRSAPTAVAGGHVFVRLAAGGEHTCGLTADGSAYCWGDNSHGQLGTGQAAGSAVPVPVAGGVSFVEIVAGNFHTCGLSANGQAFCWGHNAYGQVGDGSTTDRSAPTLLPGGPYVGMGAGAWHTCAIDGSGRAYCWGANSSGQLGDGSNTGRSSPVSVAGGLSFVAVTSGFGHTCGLAAGGQLYCWGENWNGELGDGSTATMRLTPTRVAVF